MIRKILITVLALFFVGSVSAISWSTSGDWDNAVSESKIVHESVLNTDHNDAGTIRKGYKTSGISDPNLRAYWPLHEDSGGSAHDMIDGDTGSINGPSINQEGILGTTSYKLAGGTGDHVEVPDTPGNGGGGMGLMEEIILQVFG